MSFNAIDGIVGRRIIRGAVRSYRRSTGRYTFAIFQDDVMTEEGRCHVFTGEDGVSLLDPRSGDVAVIPLSEVVHWNLPPATFRRSILSVGLANGSILTLMDTMKGQQADRLTDSLRGVVPGGRPLPGLKFFGGHVQGAKARLEIETARAEAGQRGELLPGDSRAALGEEVEAQGWCVYLGSAIPPGGPEGPGFIGFALVGPTQLGLVNPHRTTQMLWQSALYEDITTLAYREENQASSPDTYLFELVMDRGHQPAMKRYGDFVQHLAFRVHVPGADEGENVSSILIERARRLSRFDVKIGPEEEVAGLVLLPITPR